MAIRREGPDVLRNIRWDGDAPLEGFAFTVDDLEQTYHFFVPAICGNVSLVRREPSLEAARLAAVANADAVKAAAVKAAAEKMRMAAERYAAAEKERLVAEQALADYVSAQARDLRVRPFVAGLFCKQQRQYDDTDPLGLGRLPSVIPRLVDVPAFFDSLLGVKAGVALKISDSWTFVPAIGVAADIDEIDRTMLFGDAEIDLTFENGAYLGTGLTFLDFTHNGIFTPGWLGTVGMPLWRNDERLNQALFAIEYRQWFDRLSDPDVNYQFWGGLKYLFSIGPADCSISAEAGKLEGTESGRSETQRCTPVTVRTTQPSTSSPP